jgi:transcription antitermination factor NusG
MITTVLCYKTTEGKIFENLEEAKKHDNIFLSIGRVKVYLKELTEEQRQLKRIQRRSKWTQYSNTVICTNGDRVYSHAHIQARINENKRFINGITITLKNKLLSFKASK